MAWYTWYELYDSVDEFSSARQSVLEDTLFDDERFIVGIDTYINSALIRWSDKLAVTNQRLIVFSKAPFTSSVDAYDLDAISIVEFETGFLYGDLTIRGSGFEESYKLPRHEGNEFVDRLREAVSE